MLAFATIDQVGRWSNLAKSSLTNNVDRISCSLGAKINRRYVLKARGLACTGEVDEVNGDTKGGRRGGGGEE